MRKNAEAEKSQKRMAEASMDSIEARAKQQYEKDRLEAERHRTETLGSWDPDLNTE